MGWLPMFGAEADVEHASFAEVLERAVEEVDSCLAKGTGYCVHFGRNGRGRKVLGAWDER